MTSAAYTRGEVTFLLGITRDDALISEAMPRSCANFSGNESSAAVLAYDDVQLSALVRWDEVHAARRRVIARRLQEEGVPRGEIVRQLTIAVLRSWGVGGPEAAAMLGMDRFVADRRFRGLIGEILDELGGEVADGPERLDAPVPACMRCGQAPRVRSRVEVRRLVDGVRRRRVLERQTSLCAGCLAEASIRRPTGEVVGTLRDLREAEDLAA